MPLAEGPARDAPSTNAVRWTTERLNGEDGLGAIYPAMANSVMMYDVLGYPPEHPDRAIARKSVEKLLVVKDDEAYCQPCVSPVWDTALVAHALMETSDAKRRSRRGARAGMAEAAAGAGREGRLGGRKARCAPRRLGLPVSQRLLSRPGRYRRGGDGDGPRRQARSGAAQYNDAIARGAEWVEGLQSRNGGWGAFDADNSYYYLNNIPFADHGALLDPPTEDVSGRCVGMLAQLGAAADDPRLKAGVDYLIKTQRDDGSWWGRWGVNYIYGTWSALAGLNGAGLGARSSHHEDAAPTGWSKSRIRMAAGARIATATSWITKAMSPRPPPRHRPPGRCWA